MTEQELAEIEAKQENTAEGPWEGWASGSDLQVRGPSGVVVLTIPSSQNSRSGYADVRLIADAKQDVPALIAEVRRLRALIKQVEWGIDPDDPSECPWCGGGWQAPDFHFGHATTCPAFPAEAA